MSKRPTPPSRTRTAKNREMVMRALADALQRAHELAQDDPEYQDLANQVREVWGQSVIVYHDRMEHERQHYYAAVDAWRAEQGLSARTLGLGVAP